MNVRNLEVEVGFEPTNKGFADLRLRPLGYSTKIYKSNIKKKIHTWWILLSGKRDSNPRHQPWQGCALPTELFPHNKLEQTIFQFAIEFGARF